MTITSVEDTCNNLCEETFMTFITDTSVTLKSRTHILKQKLFVTEGEERTQLIQEGKENTLVTEERFHPLYL